MKSLEWKTEPVSPWLAENQSHGSLAALDSCPGQSPPCLLVAADQPNRVQALCRLLGNFGFPMTLVYEEGDALARILAHRYDDHCLLITGGSGSRALIRPARLVQRLRDMHYRNHIHLHTVNLPADEEAVYQEAAVDCRCLSAKVSLVEEVNSLMAVTPEVFPCLSVLQMQA